MKTASAESILERERSRRWCCSNGSGGGYALYGADYDALGAYAHAEQQGNPVRTSLLPMVNQDSPEDVGGWTPPIGGYSAVRHPTTEEAAEHAFTTVTWLRDQPRPRAALTSWIATG